MLVLAKMKIINKWLRGNKKKNSKMDKFRLLKPYNLLFVN
jgi:hypothetical protein